MLRIDNNLLQDVGLASLPDSEKNSLLKHIYETLEMRVGIRLADQMSNEQLDEFERYFEAKDDAGAFKWLETNFPNYKEIVQEEFDKLKAEIAQSAPQILSSSTAAQSGQPAQQPPMAAPAQSQQPQMDPYVQPQAPMQPSQAGDYYPSQAANPAMPTPDAYPGINTQNPTPPAQPAPPLYPDQQPPAGPGVAPQF